MLQAALQKEFSKTNPQVISSGEGFLGFFGRNTKGGIAVNQSTSLTLSAFYNGIELITNDFAKLPKHIIQKKDGDRLTREDHELSYLISTRPNGYMTAFSFDKIMLQYAILKGNAYAIIIRNEFTQKVTALEVINQDKTPVEVLKSNSRLFYKIDGELYSDYEILHVPGFSLNGITGISVVQMAAHSLGVSLSSQEFSSDYYNSKGEGIAVVTTQKPLDVDGKNRYAGGLRKHLEEKGPHKVAVLDEMGSFQYISLTPQESQFLLTNKYGVLEVARWLNLPPHKLKALENATFSNIEHQEIQHVSDSILPWSLKFQNEYDVKLFTSKEKRQGFQVKFNTGSLIRADLQAQAEYFSKMIHAGVMTRNEVRLLLELNKLEGLNEPLTPVNTQTLEQIDLKLKELKNKIEDVKQ
jgi:HK97 family phage portal protein